MLKQTKLTPKRRENEPQLELESTAQRKTQNKSKKTSERGKNSLPQIGELKTKLYNNSTNFQLQLRSIPKQIYNLHYDIQPKPD